MSLLPQQKLIHHLVSELEASTNDEDFASKILALRNPLEKTVIEMIRSQPPLIPGSHHPKFRSEYDEGCCSADSPWGPIWQGNPKKEKVKRRHIQDNQGEEFSLQGCTKNLVDDGRGMIVGDDPFVKARLTLNPSNSQKSTLRCANISSTFHCKMRNVVWEDNIFTVHADAEEDLEFHPAPGLFRPQMKVNHEAAEPEVDISFSDQPLEEIQCKYVVYKPAFFAGSLNFPHYGHTVESTAPLLFQTLLENSCLALDLNNMMVLTNMATPVNETLGHFSPLFGSMTSNALLSLSDLGRLGGKICFHDVTVGIASTVDVYVTPPLDPDRTVSRFTKYVTNFVLQQQGVLDSPVEVVEQVRAVNLVLNTRGAHARNVMNNDALLQVAAAMGIESHSIHFENQSLTENILSLQQVAILAGPYGSPCSNFVWLPKNSVAIHITPYGLNTHRNLEFAHLQRLGHGHLIQLDLPFNSSTWTHPVPPVATENLTQFWETEWEDAYRLFTWGQKDLIVDTEQWRDTLKQALDKINKVKMKDEL